MCPRRDNPFEAAKNANKRWNMLVLIVREHCTYRTRGGFGRYAWVLGMLTSLTPKKRE